MAMKTEKVSAFASLGKLAHQETPKSAQLNDTAAIKASTAAPIPDDIIDTPVDLNEYNKEIKEKEPVTVPTPEPEEEKPVKAPVVREKKKAEPEQTIIRKVGRPQTREEGGKHLSIWLDSDNVEAIYSKLKYGESAGGRINELIRLGLKYEKK